MIPAQRQEKVLEYLKENGAASINNLSSLLGVSEATIRRDLEELSRKGLVTRSHGGATYKDRTEGTLFEPEYDFRLHTNIEEKKRIAFKAAQLIGDGQSIILDSGSTTLEIVRYLKNKNKLKVVTNDIRIAMELTGVKTLQIMVSGGILREGMYTLIGPHAELLLDNISVDFAFIGAYAISEFGVTTTDAFQVPVKRKMIKAAREAILVADHSKFGKRLFTRVCPLSEIHEIITDNKLDIKYKNYLEKETEVRITIA